MELTPNFNQNISVGNAVGAVAGPKTLGIVQYQIPCLAAQTISGTVKGQIRASESNATADAFLQTVIKVWDPVGNSFRGTLLGINGTPSTEIDTSSMNRKVPNGWSGSGTSLSSLAVSAGDILVVEMGATINEVTAIGRTIATSAFANGNTSTWVDLPEDETDTSSVKSAWIEFSQNIVFKKTIVPMHGPRQGAYMKKIVPVYKSSNPLAGQLWPRGSRVI